MSQKLNSAIAVIGIDGQELVPPRGTRQTRRDRAAAEMVAGPGRSATCQHAPTRYIITREVPANMRATAVGLLSIFLIIGQIFGGSLAGGVFGTSISNSQAYRALYLIFAGIALLATCATSLLAPRARERSLTSTA